MVHFFLTFEAFNNGLIAVGQPAMTWNPYIEDDPAKQCDQDNDGDCT